MTQTTTPQTTPTHDEAPERIRVAQDADGFWTCREAISGSQEYVRADLASAPAPATGGVEAVLDAAVEAYREKACWAIVPANHRDALRAALAASLSPVEAGGERHWDDLAVDRFAYVMKAKLAKKRAEGYGGWDHKIHMPGLDGRGFYYEAPNSLLSRLLREHVEKGDPVDVANFCMMIHQRSERIS